MYHVRMVPMTVLCNTNLKQQIWVQFIIKIYCIVKFNIIMRLSIVKFKVKNIICIYTSVFLPTYVKYCNLKCS